MLINHQSFLFLISLSCYFRYYLLFLQVFNYVFVHIALFSYCFSLKLAYLFN